MPEFTSWHSAFPTGPSIGDHRSEYSDATLAPHHDPEYKLPSWPLVTTCSRRNAAGNTFTCTCLLAHPSRHTGRTGRSSPSTSRRMISRANCFEASQGAAQDYDMLRQDYLLERLRFSTSLQVADKGSRVTQSPEMATPTGGQWSTSPCCQACHPSK